MSRRAYAVMPGIAPMACRTLVCALSSHNAYTGHAGIARLLHPPQTRAVWAHWTAGSAVMAINTLRGDGICLHYCGPDTP